MKRVLLSVFLIVAVTLLSVAQNGAKIKFEKTVHDFGTIKEADGPARCTFNFTNVGDEPLTLKRVKPSCGCTASDYTKGAIPPGGKGYVSATYNPARRPGKFHKGITVTTNATINANSMLSIKGDVKPKPKTKADLYPTAAGNLRFKTNHLALMQTLNTAVKVDSLAILNNGKKDMSIKFDKLPSHLKIEAVPATLKPQQEGFIRISYNAAEKQDYGLCFDQVSFITTDNTKNKTLHVSADIIEDFSGLSARELKKAAKADFDTLIYDFGTVTNGEKVTYDFVLKNNGKRDLFIRKIKADCGCTAVTPETKILKKRKSTKIAVVFNTKGRKGNQVKRVTINTNDPEKPKQVITIKGIVK